MTLTFISPVCDSVYYNIRPANIHSSMPMRKCIKILHIQQICLESMKSHIILQYSNSFHLTFPMISNTRCFTRHTVSVCWNCKHLCETEEKKTEKIKDLVLIQHIYFCIILFIHFLYDG